jgi:hypothetical protein
MAPSATDVQAQTEIPIHPSKAAAKPWVKATGILEQYESFDVTPVIGREFPHANLVSWLQAPNSDELLRELALTSTFPVVNLPIRIADSFQSPNVAWSSSAHKTTSLPISKRS